MNWLDYTLLAIMAAGTIFGLLTGPIWQTYRILSVALSAVSGFLVYKLLGSILDGIFNPEVSHIIGFAIVFVVVLVLTYVIGNFFKSAITKRKFGISGRILGGGIAFAKTILTCCIIISGVTFLGDSRTGEIVNNSLIASSLEKGSKAIISKVPQDIKDKSIAEKDNNLKI